MQLDRTVYFQIILASQICGKLRDELLNRELFLSLDEARWVIDRWRLDYNHHRPHSSLEHQTLEDKILVVDAMGNVVAKVSRP